MQVALDEIYSNEIDEIKHDFGIKWTIHEMSWILETEQLRHDPGVPLE